MTYEQALLTGYQVERKRLDERIRLLKRTIQQGTKITLDREMLEMALVGYRKQNDDVSAKIEETRRKINLSQPPGETPEEKRAQNARLLDRIIELRRRGDSFDLIADTLNREGFQPRSKNTDRFRGGTIYAMYEKHMAEQRIGQLSEYRSPRQIATTLTKEGFRWKFDVYTPERVADMMQRSGL